MTLYPPLKMVDVYAATIADLALVPQVHVNYAETVLAMRDGLPKLKDFPAEFGRLPAWLSRSRSGRSHQAGAVPTDIGQV